MIPTNLIATLLAFAPGIGPAALRQELESAPWRPAPGVLAASAKSADTIRQAPAATPASAAAPAGKTPPATTASESAQSARLDAAGSWQIQLAALANPDVAKREQARIEKELGEGSVSIVQENGLSKLRWGSFKTREAADAARTELKAHQLDGFAVKAR